MRTVILAAGLGSRLGHNRPKGLLAPVDETLVQRSIRLLQEAGLGPVTLVVGHMAEHYQKLPEAPLCLTNADYATTGSLRSLLIAHRHLQDDLVVLESDLVYEPRALERLLACPQPNVILASGFTGAGDEVYVDAPGARLRNLSKDRAAFTPMGEFVGINRFSHQLLQALESWGESHPEAHYESDGLVALCDRHPVHVELIADLIWCEVDDPEHWRRCQTEIYPRLLEKA